jgi:LuxR family transcriptional regulator, glucitol operon activator
MGYNASRLTLYAILSAIENDLRNAICLHLDCGKPAREILGQYSEKIEDRFEAEVKFNIDNPPLDRLLCFADFTDLYSILNASRSLLPQPLAKYYKEITPRLDRLVQVRNRIAHTRPLLYHDFPETLDFAEEQVKKYQPYWFELHATLNRLAKEPSFVLGLQIPVYEQSESGRHNLPTPDFDETGFLGRKQVVSDLIRHCRGPYPVITIVGEGGLGKTALALKAAYDILDLPDCPFSAIVWTSSKTAQITPHEIIKIEGAICDSLNFFQNLASKLVGRNVQDGDPFAEVLNYLKDFKILLILDNLETVLDLNQA